jgi:hypothetical protein
VRELCLFCRQRIYTGGGEGEAVARTVAREQRPKPSEGLLEPVDSLHGQQGTVQGGHTVSEFDAASAEKRATLSDPLELHVQQCAYAMQKAIADLPRGDEHNHSMRCERLHR